MGSNIPPDKIASWIEANFEYRTRRDGEEYTICNPFDGDSDYKFNISISKGVCHYWRGDEWAPFSKNKSDSKSKSKRDTSFIRFVSLYKKCSIREAIAEVTGRSFSGKLRPKKQKPEPEEHKDGIDLPPGFEPLHGTKDRLGLGLMKWLASRGVNSKLVEELNIGYVGSDVIWPYYEYGELVYWQSRSRINKTFRFPSSDVGVTKGDFLYGFDRADTHKYVAITEAIFDAITLGRQTLASGGAVLTERQIVKLKLLRPSEGVVLAPDNDQAGIDSVIANAKLLSKAGFKLYYAIPPVLQYRKDGESRTTKDWNEIGQYAVGWDGVQDIFKKSIKSLSTHDLIRLRGTVYDRKFAKSRSQSCK